jgi:galactokinase/mevalonate kinase-like predicted kinase
MAEPNSLLDIITSSAPEVRDRSLDHWLRLATTSEVLQACEILESFRKTTTNLYERVRATIFLHALYRYRLQQDDALPSTGFIPYEAVQDQLERRFEQAISRYRETGSQTLLDQANASALASAYEQLAFQTLADQVRRSVRSAAGNRWMFRIGAADEHPLRIHRALLERDPNSGLHPLLAEKTSVRLDLSHSAWSDIFFLGMDFPEGARVLNISVDLAVYGRDTQPSSPITTYCRVIPEPVLRLTSIDLGTCKDVATLAELFNFGNDYLSLVKAGVVASGLIPPAFEGTRQSLADVLSQVIRPGFGLEIVSQVNDIPKGSRLAVSTNLLASLITLLMRATGQARSLTGPLEPEEARVVVARAILGEWLGGSGGGWQDSGGIFPGVKRIEGTPPQPDDPESGISRGRLQPVHTLITPDHAPGFHEALARSLVLVHGGMAQNVGPILNMVTEKYLLRSRPEWELRQEALRIFDRILQAVHRADIRELGRLTSANWEGPLKGIIPWVSNRFTETIIAQAKQLLGDQFWGFLMLGGMSGGGMGFFVDPARRDRFRDEILTIMHRTKRELEDALPFAMEPVVYDFAINPQGTVAELRAGRNALLPARYYSLQTASMIASPAHAGPERRADLDYFVTHHQRTDELVSVFRNMVGTLFPVARSAADPSVAGWDAEAERIRKDYGFDPVEHEMLRESLQRGRIGLARNRLPESTDIRDVDDAILLHADATVPGDLTELGSTAIQRGLVAVVSLAAGVGSRWTTGAGVVKAVNPFVWIDGAHRSFLEIHLAKTRQTMDRFQVEIPHIVTTSFLTHHAVKSHLDRTSNYTHPGPVYISQGMSIAQRLVPMARDLVFLWEEQPHETLDENKQKVRESGRRAILEWARHSGEGSDYVNNTPIQRFNPPGHFYEFPTMLRNGLLHRVITQHPRVEWLMLHNIDTLGANIDPAIFGLVQQSDAAVVFEVIPRRFDDRGGGLALVDGEPRLLEGLAQPRENTEFKLRYYNTLTTWVHIDRFLSVAGLNRNDLAHAQDLVSDRIRALAARVPTYVTIKDVKRRWGHGQEDVFPVAQFEKLWGDISAWSDLPTEFLVVPRLRGQQLKDTAQLDGWSRDGSRDYVCSICRFST